MNINQIYIFYHPLPEEVASKLKIGEAIAIWYDGESGLLNNLNTFFQFKELYVEDFLFNSRGQFYVGLSSDVKTYPSPIQEIGEPKICILPSNDTHVFLLKEVASILETNLVVTKLKFENALGTIRDLALNYSSFEFKNNYDSLVVANDWGDIEKPIVKSFNKKGKPTFCLQESIIDFGDDRTRMEQCDYPLIQGLKTTQLLNRKIYFLTGNPRYENLLKENLPSKDIVMINVNFTYGIHESIRAEWVNDIVSVVKSQGCKYFISQHPRDTGNLEQYNVRRSSASSVHQMLRESSMLITRFSSLIHEALAMGRPVIYYNPHNELLNYDFEPDGKNLIIVTSIDDLSAAIEELSLKNLDIKSFNVFRKKYLINHIGLDNAPASQRVAKVISLFSHATLCNKVKITITLKEQLRFSIAKVKALFVKGH